MAVSSTSSSTNSTTSIDVTSIVSQLMVAENKPMVALKDKITSKNLLISDLGTLKGKVASFQTALKNLQTPGSLAATVATSSDESVVQITSSGDAIKGRHDIVVNQVAQPAQITYDNFDSSTANAGLLAGDTFSISIGSRGPYVYEPPTDVSIEDSTIQDLKNWVNALDDSLSASIIRTSGSNYALMIQGTEPGSDNAITYSHTPSVTIGTAITGTSATPSNDSAGFVLGDTFTLTSGGINYTKSDFAESTTISEVQNWINSRLPASSINGSSQLVLSNGATYTTTRPAAANTPITGSTGSPSDLAGFLSGDTFSVTSGGNTYTNSSFTNTTTISDVQTWLSSAPRSLSSSINGSNQLVMSNGETYTTTRSVAANTPITGSAGTSAGFLTGDTFSLSFGGQTYTNTSFTSSTTIAQVQNWISSQLPSSSINGSKELVVTGATYSRTVSDGLGSPLNRPKVVDAQDASFTLDGVEFTRNTNTVTDALSGITINLIKADTGIPHSISVNKGADKAPEVMQGLVDAFNDLVTTAKKLSVRASPSSSSSANGSLANSPTALSFLGQIKTMLAGDIHYTLAGVEKTLSMRDLGFEMQFDGTAKFNETTFNATSNLATILASGIKVGYATYVERDPDTGEVVTKNTIDVTLDSYLTSLLTTTKIPTDANDLGYEMISGAFDRQIKNEQSGLAEMTKKQVALQIRLEERQKSLYSQYSALNALLYKLSITSNSLTNALSGLTNGQNNN